MVAAKPDCTGQKFGMLRVLGKGKVVRSQNGRTRRLWDLECDCGATLSLSRYDFDRPTGRAQKSCGCLGKNRKGKVDNKRRPLDLAGQRFGALVAIEIIPGLKDKGSIVWECRCDCGNTCKKSARRLRHRTSYGLHCGAAVHLPGAVYPVAPIPYPDDASNIVSKYLHLTEYKGSRIDAALRDMKMDRLLRAAWIIAYRRRQGETISDLYEKRYIRKCLRYCSINLFWQRKIEAYGGEIVTMHGIHKKIGSVMTDLTSQNEAASTQGKTQPEIELPKRRIRFKRC